MNPSDEPQNMIQEPSASSRPATPGERLVQARAQRGLSSEQVARETNLSLRYVHALEQDDYDILPGAAFIRGYLRRYAQLVQLPADELVAAFDHIWAHRSPTAGSLADAMPPAGKRPLHAAALGNSGIDLLAPAPRHLSVASVLSWGSLALLLLLLLGSLFWNGSGNSSETFESEPMPLEQDVQIESSVPSAPEAALPVDPAAVPEAAAFPADPAAAPAAAVSATPSATLPAAGTAAAPTAAVASDPVIVRPAALPSPVATTPAQPGGVPVQTVPAARPSVPAPASGTVVIPVAPVAAAPTAPASVPPRIDTLNFSFTGRSWISVRDATGQELVYGLKSQGQAVTVTGQAPFSINIGNVKVTTLSRNGQPVSLKPYTRGEIASFRLPR